MALTLEEIATLPRSEFIARLRAENEQRESEAAKAERRDRRAKLYAEAPAPIVTKAMPKTAAATPSRARMEFAADCARMVEQQGGSAEDAEFLFREILSSDRTYRDCQLRVSISQSMGSLLGTQRKEIDGDIAALKSEISQLRSEVDALKSRPGLRSVA